MTFYKNLFQPLMLILCVVFFVVWSVVFFQFTVDDSFITWRYGVNLVNSGVWNWNPSTVGKVEAYTNFSYAVLSIIPAALKVSPALFFKAVGFSLLLYLLWRINLLAVNAFAKWVAFCFILFNPYTYIHFYSGLETPLFIVLLFELFVYLFGNKTMDKTFFLILLLLPLTRPEGAIFSAIGLLYQWRYGLPKGSGFYFPLFVLVITGLAYFFLRYEYFGSLLPNTFYAKENWANALDFPKNLMAASFYVYAALLIFVFTNNKGLKVATVATGIALLFAYAPASLMMNFADRFYFQIFFPLIVVYIMFTAENDFFVTKKIMPALIAVTIVLASFTPRNLQELMVYTPNLNNAHIALGKALHKYQKDNYTLVAGDVGAIPFYSGWNTIDYIGLANVYAAKHRGLDEEYLTKKKPEVFMLYSSDPSSRGVDKNLYKQGVLLNYIENNQFSDPIPVKWTDSKYLLLYIKKGINDFDDISDSLKVCSVFAEENNSSRIGKKAKELLRQQVLKDL